MAALKITKKHHKHLNNPFPRPPKSLPFIQGKLYFDPHSLPSHHLFPLGTHFRIVWNSKDGGSLSVSHQSDPSRPIWSTIPGQAFVSAALSQTEVEESRGSFAINERELHLLCNHQTVEDIRVIDRVVDGNDPDSRSGFSQTTNLNQTQFPVLQITGWVFRRRTKKKKKKKRALDSGDVLGNVLLGTNETCVSARYWVLFDQKSSNQIGFEVKIGEPKYEFQSSNSPGRYMGVRKKMGLGYKARFGWFWFLKREKGFATVSSSDEKLESCVKFNKVCLTYSSEANESFYGFGEQFSHMDFKGKRVPIFVQEQGIGRGDQPVTLAANMVSYRSGGDWSTTYAPSPFYMTSNMRSLYLEGYDYSVFDLTRDDRVQIQIHGDSMKGRILQGNSPSELIENFTGTVGRLPELPEWIISGAVVGLQGGTETVGRVWNELQRYDVPISAFWLQDWVGRRETIVGSQLWWNWEVDTTRYPGWHQLLKHLTSHNIKAMAYCNPCLAPADGKQNRRRDHFEEAKKLDILVKDGKGKVYMVPNTAFDVGMVDFTHPSAPAWFKQILQEMVDSGVRGWMADFGEGLPVDAVLYSGEDPILAHNRYPELWAQINREFVEEWEKRHSDEDGLVFFMRAGFRESPKWGMLFWEGDQMVSWERNDGIKSAVTGLLSSGLSGYAFNHSDIGGYCAVDIPFLRYHRSQELLLRWMELNAFSTVFRTHEGNKPSCNSQFYSNHQTLSQFARFAKVYKAWKFYRVELVKEAAKRGLPVCRHLFIHYPDDKHVGRLTYQQFLVGAEILVVPVLDKRRNSAKAYFPMGDKCCWKHIWSGDLYAKQGIEVWIDAPIGYPAVFVKTGSYVGQTFLNNLRDSQLIH